MLKRFLVVLILLASYFLYSNMVLKPHEIKNFSLIDDGQSILYANYFKDCFQKTECSKLKSEIIERRFGRFRPLYWATQSLFLNTLGINAQLQHEARVYFVGGLMLVLLILLMFQAKSNPVAIAFASAIFITSYTFSENIIRLGPIEPFQVITLGFFSFYYLSMPLLSKKFGRGIYFFIFSIFLLAMILIKETSVAIIPVALIHTLISRSKKKDFWLVGSVMFLGLIILVISIMVAGKGTEVAYSSNYSANPLTIIKNGIGYLQQFYWMLGFTLKFFIFGIIVLLGFGRFKNYIRDSQKTYWFLIIIFFTGILAPWPYVLERYLLITIFSFSILLSIISTDLIALLRHVFKVKGNIYRAISFNIILVIVFSNIFFRGSYIDIVKTLNYQSWFKSFTQFEADQVKAISLITFKDRLYINATDSLDDWEVTFEIPIHLHYFYNQDVAIPQISSLNEKGYLFSRSSFVSKYELDYLESNFGNNNLIASKTYIINQIDYLAFKKNFFLRPLQTLENPPLNPDPLKYYWEVRKLN